jgi:hypothetical protein
MRKYQPIWELIKDDMEATIVAPLESHNIIIKQVIKEKYKDCAFRLLCDERNVKYKLQINADNKKGTITFKLIDATSLWRKL